MIFFPVHGQFFIPLMKKKELLFSCSLPTSDPISGVGTLKYDWLKIGEMYMFAESICRSIIKTCTVWDYSERNYLYS